MKFIIGKKLDMTVMWQGEKAVAVSRVQAGPCPIVQIKEKERDGYVAVQIGYGEKKEKNIKKPQKGHLNKLKAQMPARNASHLEAGGSNVKTNVRNLKEFRCSKDEIAALKIGDVIDVDTFSVGDTVKVTGTSKGKGFQGVVKRHGFHGQDKTHGNKDQLRMPGSIGAQAPQRVFKGVRMPGRMGGERVTTTNLEIISVDKENNILLIKGSVPGARNSLVMIRGEGELRINTGVKKEVAVEEKGETEAEIKE